MNIRVLFIDEWGQRRLLVVNEIGQSNDNGTVWIENKYSYFESVNTISDYTYKDLIEFALIHGYVDFTTMGKFKEVCED